MQEAFQDELRNVQTAGAISLVQMLQKNRDGRITFLVEQESLVVKLVKVHMKSNGAYLIYIPALRVIHWYTLFQRKNIYLHNPSLNIITSAPTLGNFNLKSKLNSFAL